MSQPIAFADALEAAEHLTDDDQAALASILTRRVAERGRDRITASIEQARRESAAGQCLPMTAAEIVAEAQS